MSHNDSKSDNNEEEDILNEFKPKIKEFFSNTPSLTSKVELDSFLDSCGLLEIWNTDEEKTTLWNSLWKHRSIHDEITYESALKGLKEIIAEEGANGANSENNSVIERASSSENIRPSKLNAFTTYLEEIDNDKILQLQKIMVLLDINNRNVIYPRDIKEMLSKYKFIKISFEEITEFMQLLGENMKNAKNFSIEQNLLNRISKEMEIKLNKDQDVFGNAEGGLGNALLYGNNMYGGSGDIYEENEEGNPVELIEEIVQKEAETLDYMNILLNIKNEFYSLNNTLVSQYERFINGDDEKLANVDDTQQTISKKIKEYDLFVKDISDSYQSNNMKIENLKTLIFKQNNKMKVMEDDYRQLYQQFTSNQQLDMNDEMERLIDENIILTRDKEEKNAMIDKLQKEINEKDNTISTYQIQFGDLNKEKEELQSTIHDLTASNEKLKNEYNVLVNDVLEKIKKEEEKQREQNKFNQNEMNSVDNNNNATNENNQQQNNEQDKSININNNTSNEKTENNNINTTNNTKVETNIDISSIDFKKLTIPEIHELLKKYNLPTLIDFTLKLSHSFQKNAQILDDNVKTLEDYNTKITELKEELTSVKLTNAKLVTDNNGLKTKLETYKSEAELNEAFRPSTVLGSQLRISRMSRIDPNAAKNMFQQASYSNNMSSAAFFGGQKKPTQNIDVVQEGNEDEEEEDKNNPKPKTKEEDEDDGDLEITSNIKNIPIAKGESSNKDTFSKHPPKSARHKPQSKSFALTNPLFAFANDINMEDEEEDDNEKKRNSNEGSVEIKTSIPDPVIEDDNVERSSMQIKTNVDNNTNIPSFMNFEKEEDNDIYDDNSNEKHKLKPANKFKERMKQMKKYNTNTNFKIRGKGIDSSSGKAKKILDDTNLNRNINMFNIEGVDKSVFEPGKCSSDVKDKNQTNETNTNNNIPNDTHTKTVSFTNKLAVESSITKVNIPSKVNQLNKVHTINTTIDIPKLKNRDKKHSRHRSDFGVKPLSSARTFHNFFFDINETKSKNRDFLHLRTSKNLISLLKKRNEVIQEDKIFSDHIFDIEWNDRKTKAMLILTANSIVLLHPEDQKEKLYQKSIDLQRITLSNRNPNFVLFDFKDGESLCVETMRRLELLYFVRDNYRHYEDGKKVPIKYTDNVVIAKNTKKFNISVTGKLFNGTGNFECAKKFGYLYKYNSRIIGSNFTERLVVLTDVGLLYYDYVNKPPKRLIPIVGSKITVVLGNKYKMAAVFELVTYMNELYVFGANSELERDSWVEELGKVQKIYEEKMKSIDTIITREKEEDVENDMIEQIS